MEDAFKIKMAANYVSKNVALLLCVALKGQNDCLPRLANQ